jgi:hypothetical protein
MRHFNSHLYSVSSTSVNPATTTPVRNSDQDLDLHLVPDQDDRFWQSPKVLTVVLALICFAVFYLLSDAKTQRLLVIQAKDQSASALAITGAETQQCKAILNSIKTGDRLMVLTYADRPEIMVDSPVQNTIGLLRQCNEQTIPNTIGRRQGTSPVQMLSAVLVALESARIRGNTDPVLVSVWLQAAEPVPGDPPLDWAQFQAQVDTITANNGVVSIFGPTGELQQQLKAQLKHNSQAEVWPLEEVEQSVTWAYEVARQLPALD